MSKQRLDGMRSAVNPDFILMDDNTRPLRARMVGEFLESDDIRWMDWTARSIDLKPIQPSGYYGDQPVDRQDIYGGPLEDFST
ncbi:hypothetical protein TNCV_3303791 [Trichonephila clavipes]|nr:hypothetical protein TNCV_3303791 [Trichonephila clavipes]